VLSQDAGTQSQTVVSAPYAEQFDQVSVQSAQALDSDAAPADLSTWWAPHSRLTSRNILGRIIGH